MSKPLPLLLIGVLIGCDALDEPAARNPAQLEAFQGDDQQAVEGRALQDSLVVRVLDSTGQPVPGQNVLFRVLSGGGTVSPTSAVSDRDGLASTLWILGSSADSQRVEARASSFVTGEALASIVFRAQALSPVAGVRIKPDSAVFVALGDTARFGATVLGVDGESLTSIDVSWASTDSTIIAIDSTGLALARANGTALVIASAAARSDSAVVRVSQVPAAIEISPAVDTLNAIGDTIQLSAVVRDRNGVVAAGAPVTWSVLDAFIATDQTGRIISSSVGLGRVVAASGGVADTATVLVRQVSTGIEISPAADTINAIGDTIQLSAVVRDSNGVVVSAATVSWSVLDAFVTTDQTGRIISNSVGLGRVVATSGGVADTATVLVRQVAAGIEISPAADTMNAIGDTIQLSAVVRDSNSVVASGATVSWSVLDAFITTDQTGRIISSSVGLGRVVATSGGLADTATVLVRQVAARIDISPAADTMNAIGDTIQLSAVVRDSNSVVVSGATVTWSVLDAFIATDQTGRIISSSVGLGRVVATSGGAADTATVLVRQIPASVSVSVSAVVLILGDTARATAVVADSNGVNIPGTSVIWTSSDSAIASVDFTGRILARGGGSATITATVNGASANAIVTVTQLLFTSVTAGGSLTCGIVTTARGYCWGKNFGNKPARVPGAPSELSFIQMSAGNEHACGLATDNRVYCWGTNTLGQLGDGTTTSNTTPVLVAGARTYKSVSAGLEHTCAVASDDRVYCWGFNLYGQLGDSTTANATTPQLVKRGLAFRSISAGASHTCAVTTGGSAYCWGRNNFRQLGQSGLTAERDSSPVLVSGGLSLTAISAGGSHTCALSSGGDAYCWGSNEVGQLGIGATGGVRDAPAAVTGGRTFSIVSAGRTHSCALTTGGAAYCWGEDDSGQLGDDANFGTNRGAPTPVAATVTVVYSLMSAGREHTCAVAADRSAYCWGRNLFGQLGDRSNTDTPSPVRVAGSS